MTFWRDLIFSGRTRRVHEIAERSTPTAEEAAWLRAETERDPSVAATYARLRRWHDAAARLPETPAPRGFADQVLRRARAEPAPLAAPKSRSSWGWGGLAAAGVAAFVIGIEMRSAPTDIATSGSSGWWAEASPHLVIRAPDIGAVEARDVFESNVAELGGRAERLESSVVARVNRDALLPLLQALSEHGPFEVTRPVAAADLPAEVTLRLELAR